MPSIQPLKVCVHMYLNVALLSLRFDSRYLLCYSCCQVTSVVSNSVRPHRRQPPGSSVPGVLQARTLEWVAISFSSACTHAKSLQSCPTLCIPMDSSPPDSAVHRILYGVGCQFLLHNGILVSKSCSVVPDSLRPHGLYVAYQAPQSMEFSRQEHWSGLPFPSPRQSCGGFI